MKQASEGNAATLPSPTATGELSPGRLPIAAGELLHGTSRNKPSGSGSSALDVSSGASHTALGELAHATEAVERTKTLLSWATAAGELLQPWATAPGEPVLPTFPNGCEKIDERLMTAAGELPPSSAADAPRRAGP